MRQIHFDRREMLKAAGLAAAGAAGLVIPRRSALAQSPAGAATSPSGAKRSIRLAHVTDVHVQPELRAPAGLVSCLHHVQSLEDKPQLIINGGDCVFDSFISDDARTQQQWDVWNAIIRDESSLPMRSAIGNHDIWGGDRKASKTTGRERNYGKQRAMDNLGLAERYYFFDQAGWRFIVLDSTQPDWDGDFTAYLDEPQFDWLRRTLRDTPATTPIVIVSHIPILSAAVLMWAKVEGGRMFVGTMFMHADFVAIKDLFAQHPNVKLCLSGHLHLADQASYQGVTYVCNGAVCGDWWVGPFRGCEEGYGVVDLYDDGTFACQYINYGWDGAASKTDPSS